MASHSNPVSSPSIGSHVPTTWASARPSHAQPRQATPLLNTRRVSMNGAKAHCRKETIREAVLLSFCNPSLAIRTLLQELSAREWSNLLHWLDISGLALYFLDQVTELGWCGWLPFDVVARLQQNLEDNRERTFGMITESISIQKQFQSAGITYAVLKGFSLSPYAVPKAELRHQFDLDLLIFAQSAPIARHLLEERGYSLYAVSGRSWEFKIEAARTPMKNFYKNMPGRSVELHVEAEKPEGGSSLERRVYRPLSDISMPVLSPVDLFLAQGLHAYKDVNSAFSRTSHLLEFRHHVLIRHNDTEFWQQLQQRAEATPDAAFRLGLVVLLITHVMGEFAPPALASWTVDLLPRFARLWVDLYGTRTVLQDYPGSKLYLLLQREFARAGLAPSRSLREALLPSRLPPPVIRAAQGETLAVRADRYRLQFQSVLTRSRFHAIEGARYFRELNRWRQEVDGWQ